MMYNMCLSRACPGRAEPLRLSFYHQHCKFHCFLGTYLLLEVFEAQLPLAFEGCLSSFPTVVREPPSCQNVITYGRT